MYFLKAIRIAIVDDSEIFRTSLRTSLERQSDFVIVAEGESGFDAIGIADEVLPDIILMDVNMPLMNGLAATRVICANFPETRVIVLSMHSDESIMVKAKEFGAHSFLTKECPPSDIVAAIKAASPCTI
jgi:two-component system response regulator DegU